MKLARLFCFVLVILGTSAIATHAQTPLDPGYTIHGSPCIDAFCVQLVYTGPTTCFTYLLDCGSTPSSGDGPFLFGLATPVTGVTLAEILNGTFNCSAVDLPGIASDDFSGSYNNYTFLGCNYFGLLTNGLSFTWNSTVVSPLAANEELEVVPEPSSSVLFMSGLVLLFLGGFARKRLGANFPT
jgi:hypothetical protein